MDLTSVLASLAEKRACLPVLRTHRLVLRPWRDDDREPFAALNADPEVMAHLMAPLSREASDAMIERMRLHVARRGFGVWAVEERATRAFVGMIGLTVPSFEAPFLPAVEVLWRFGRPYWGQGLAFEAASEVLACAFGRLGLPQVLAFTTPANERSWRLMERLGMVQVGTFDHPNVPEGHASRPHLRFAINAPAAVIQVAPTTPAPALPPVPPARPKGALPKVWIDGDGCPRAVKDTVLKAAQRGAVEVTMVANREVAVPRHARIQTVVVSKGMDVADDWLVAHAGPGDLVVTSDVPLAAELVPRGVEVVSPRGEWFTPSNIGEKLSLRDYFTEARASGMMDGGGGPPPYDDRAKKAFADGLNGWITRRSR